MQKRRAPEGSLDKKLAAFPDSAIQYPATGVLLAVKGRMAVGAFVLDFQSMYIEGAFGMLSNSRRNFVRRNVLSVSAIPSQSAVSNDQELIREIREKRPEALSRLYDMHSTLVYSIAMRVLHDAAAAEDVMQEVFLKLWQQPDSFRGERGSLCAWLTVVTRNRAIDRVRGSRSLETIDDLQIANNIDLGADAEREILIEKTRVILKTMPHDQRQALEMAFFDGQTHTEIAEQTGQPLGTVKSRIRSALISLRKALGASA